MLRKGLLTTGVDAATGGLSANAMDAAPWESPDAARLVGGAVHRIATLPFDHARRATSALVDDGGDRLLVVKGAPEQVMVKCTTDLIAITVGDECGLTLYGFLVFADEPKAAARESLAQLAALGIEVKVATGDNAQVVEKVCAELGLTSKGTITGAEMDTLDDAAFDVAAQNHTIFARIAPEQKARLIVAARRTGRSVGFLGDGVNDALALHAADVGISVGTAADVAKDAADVVLLEKDLGVLAAGVAEGRRIFANTIKYLLMGTSSNFGNMFSAAAASAVLTFLPMLPTRSC